MKQYKIYMYTFPNGKRYIGMTSQTLEARRDCGYNHNKGLKEAIRRYGWRGFKKEILEDGLTEEQAYGKEKEYISLYDTANFLKGYNISLGGKETFKGLKHSEEHKRYISGLYKGKKFTEEHIENLCRSHVKQRKAVEQINSQGESIRRFKSLKEAAESVGGYKTNISRACKENKPYKGWMWRYAEGGEF